MGLDPFRVLVRRSCEGTAALHAFALHSCGDLTPSMSLAKKGRGAGRRMREEQTGEDRRAEHQERGGGKERPHS